MIQRYQVGYNSKEDKHLGVIDGEYCASEDVAKLEAENERLRQALEIIADDKSLSFVVQQIAKGALED